MASFNFPRDVELMLIRKMGIDERRALGVYTPLKVPNELKTKISETLARHTSSIHTFYEDDKYVNVKQYRVTLWKACKNRNIPVYCIQRSFRDNEMTRAWVTHYLADERGNGYINSYLL